MFRFALLILTLTAGLMACRTTNPGLDGSDAPSALSDAAVAELSEEARCEFSGGELIEGDCYCSDGTRTFEFQGKAKTCAQWIKQNYQACYSKGGTAKRNDKGHDCFCPHGETIDENGTQTCYQKFAAKNTRCSATKGIVLAEDRTCRCLHGVLAENLEAAGTTCTADHKSKFQRCHDRGGLSRDEGTCECRDGTFIHKDENATCADKWFFHEESVATNQKGSGGQAANSQTTCQCQLHNGSLWLWKPNKQGIYLKKPTLRELGITAAEVNGAKCIDEFRDKIYEAVQADLGSGGCGGSWTYIATAATGSAGKTNFSSEVDPNDMCVCKEFTGTTRETYRCGPYGRQVCSRNVTGKKCGVFKPKSNEHFISWDARYGCDRSRCTSIAGGSESLYRYCPKYNGTPMWRTE